MIRKFQSNVNIVNPLNILYIKGNESTDGSIRFILNSGFDNIEIEKREDGIWNPTDLEINTRFVIDDNTGNMVIDFKGNIVVTR